MSLITRAVANGIEWGISSSVAGVVKGKIRDFAEDRRTYVTHTQQRIEYSRNGRFGHSQSFALSETVVYKEPSKLTKVMKTIKKKVIGSISKVKSAINKQ